MARLNEFLPYVQHSVDEDDITAVVDVLRGKWLTTGPSVSVFERALENKVGAKHALAVSSGTAALHIAALTVGLGPGDCAIVPTITFVATANAVRYCGADVIFADVEPDTGLMGPVQFEAAIVRARQSGKKLKAVFPVHIAGQCSDLESILEIANREGILVIEDASHAIGTCYQDRSGVSHKIGACKHSAITIFSFHPAKTIAMGEGGAVTTNNLEYFDRLEKLRSHGLERNPGNFVNSELAVAADGSANPWYYEMPDTGFNYRASDLHCALGTSQLGKLDNFVLARRRAVEIYFEKFSRHNSSIRPFRRVEGCDPAWHTFVILVDFPNLKIDRATLMNSLRQKNIGTQVLYIPVHLQPYYQKVSATPFLAGAEDYYSKCLSLPLSANISEEKIDAVVGAIKDIAGTSW
jgi:UDP-4-amino-4,6-dideoxy-N-acetyl-beta-L-altrosamine transaminase